MANTQTSNKATTLPELLETEKIKKRFTEILEKNAGNFMQSILTLYNSSDQLKDCNPYSILAAAGLAATLNLSITPSLGHAYIVPFSGKAQFQIGWKGIVQLAHRTGKYAALHSGKVYEGQIRGIDCITGELIRGEKISDEVIGYVAYMKLTNGFEKTLYMTKEEVEAHALKYSQTYKSDKQRKWSTWAKEFDSMACKTVLKLLISKWGVLSTDLSTAIQADQAVVTKSTFTYVDNGGTTVPRAELPPPTESADMIIDTETGEIKPAETGNDIDIDSGD